MKKIKIEKDIIIREENFGGLLFNRKKRELFELNKSGFFIINEINKNTPPEEIILKMVKKYNLPKSKAEKDFNFFIRLLKKENFLL